MIYLNIKFKYLIYLDINWRENLCLISNSCESNKYTTSLCYNNWKQVIQNDRYQLCRKSRYISSKSSNSSNIITSTAVTV